jgi:hypothetical protein
MNSLFFTDSVIKQFNNLPLFTSYLSEAKPTILPRRGDSGSNINQLFFANRDDLLNVRYKSNMELYVLHPMIKVAQIVSNLVLFHVLPFIGVMYESSYTGYYLTKATYEALNYQFFNKPTWGNAEDNLNFALESADKLFVEGVLSLLAFSSLFLFSSFLYADFFLAVLQFVGKRFANFLFSFALGFNLIMFIDLMSKTCNPKTFGEKLSYYFGYVDGDGNNLNQNLGHKPEIETFVLNWKINHYVFGQLDQLKSNGIDVDSYYSRSTKNFNLKSLPILIYNIRTDENTKVKQARENLIHFREAFEILEKGSSFISSRVLTFDLLTEIDVSSYETAKRIRTYEELLKEKSKFERRNSS